MALLFYGLWSYIDYYRTTMKTNNSGSYTTQVVKTLMSQPLMAM